MELREILRTENINLLDSNVFYSKGGILLSKLYDCKEPQDIPCKQILSEIEITREIIPYFQRNNVFSIPEVRKEVEVLLEKINNMLYYHLSKSKPIKEYYGVRRKEEMMGKRRKKFKEERYKTSPNEDFKEEAVSSLNLFAKETNKLIRSIKGKDITTKFSEKEKKDYEEYLHYFVHVTRKEKLKRDFHDKYQDLKNRTPCDFKTDEKLVSVAFTLALNQNVNIISSDSDIKRMINFFNKDKFYKSRFNLSEVKNNVFLYSDFGQGYELDWKWS